MARRDPEDEEQLLGDFEEKKELLLEKPNSKVTWKNLPQKKQLLLLALCRLSTPLSNACLLPYLYFLVKSILSDPDHPSAPQEVSRLTGLLVAAYPLGQMSTSMVWGRFSDTYGRKLAILLGLTISVISNLAFGFSRSIGMLLFWRVVAGMANGTLGVMRTMTAEIVKEKKYHSRAFLALPVVFNSGRVAALAIGGCLADPNDHIPWLFGPTGLFNFSKNTRGVVWTATYPYALPALFNGIVLAICLLLALLWLEESLPIEEITCWKLKNSHKEILLGFLNSKLLCQKSHAYNPIETERESPSPNGQMLEFPQESQLESQARPKLYRPPLREIWAVQLFRILVSFGLLPLHNATFLHLFPVFLSMPATKNDHPTVFRFTGGLGLTSPTIGLYLATFGVCGILLQLFIYPRIQKHIGNLGVFRLSNFIFIVAYIFAPYLSLLSDHDTIKWVAMAGVLFTQVMGRTMAIPSSVILLTEAAPHKSALGTVNSAGGTLSALSSAVGPIIGGAIFARGIEVGAVGIVWWCWLLLIAFVALGWSFLLGKESSVDSRAEMQLE